MAEQFGVLLAPKGAGFGFIGETFFEKLAIFLPGHVRAHLERTAWQGLEPQRHNAPVCWRGQHYAAMNAYQRLTAKAPGLGKARRHLAGAFVGRFLLTLNTAPGSSP